jgi:pyruvate formate lyase activating enzyme
VVRIPLIPTVTDTEENLSAVAALMQKHGAKNVELLPYNPMAGGKYAMVGRRYEPGFPELTPVSAREEIFRAYGIHVKVL